MKKKYVCIWFAPTYASMVKTVELDFFNESNGFTRENRLNMSLLDVKEQCEDEDLLIIRLS